VSLKTPYADIPLYPGKYLFPYEIAEDGDCRKPVGLVTKGSKNPNGWGLRNLSEDVWSSSDPDGNETVRASGEVLRIRPDVRIDFPECEGQITEFILT
jgi:hypothetical protein